MESNNKSVALYVRCSTVHQDTQLQKDDLLAFAQRRGWTVYGIFEDKGVSGARDTRPGLDRMMSEARKRKFDVVAVWRFDRFTRSLSSLIQALNEFDQLKIDFVSFSESIDTTTPAGRLVFGVIGSIAEFERELIRERVRAGVRRARAAGVKFGRPRKGVNFAKVLQDHQQGASLRQIARDQGVSHTTIRRLLDSVSGSEQ